MDFKLPANIRQIGIIEEGIKIYVEDYVHTYLKLYADSGINSEKIAFLVGKYMIIDGSPYLFINGAIQGKYSKYEDNMEIFTKESYDEAYQELSRHFSELEIVGWMQSQPGYGTHINPSYADYHMNNFIRPYQCLFVVDQILKQSMFYTWNESMTGMAAKEGYFIYYDSNPQMQAYMQENRIQRTNKTEKNIVYSQNIEDGGKNFEIVAEKGKKINKNQRKPSIRTTNQENKNIKRDKEPKKGNNFEEYKKVSNLLVGLCAVLFITTFVMGAGILQSDSRIGELENTLNSITQTHNSLAYQIQHLASLPVFAETSQLFSNQNEQGQNQDTDSQIQNITNQDTDENIEQAQNIIPPDDNYNYNYVYNNTEIEDIGQYLYNVPESYIVQAGDSLLLISNMFYGHPNMVQRIMEINNIYYADMIRIGDIIQLPRY